MALQKVKDHSNLRRDENTQAIISVDNGEWYKAKARRVEEQISRDRNESLKKLQHQVTDLSEQLDRIMEKLDAPKPSLFERIFGKRNLEKGKAGKRETDT